MSLFRFLLAIYRGALGGAMLLCGGLNAAHAQDAIPAPAPLKIPCAVAIPGTVKAPANLVAPGAVESKDSFTAPAKVSVGGSVVLAQLQSGALTAQAAWESGHLTIEDVVRAVNASRLFENQNFDQVRLRGVLIELLLEHGAEKWLPIEGKVPKPVGTALNDRALLAVADALSAKRDERAIAIYEAMLLPMERTRPNLRAVGALNHLASFYWDGGKLQEAADVFARGERYSTSPEWAAALRLDGARVYKQMGNETKAKELYDQVARFGSGWGTGLAAWDQASVLMAEGKQEQARQLLQTPVTGEGTDQINVVLSETLAESYYLSGDTQAAREHAQKSLQAFQTLGAPRASVKEFAERTGNILAWLDLWEKTPLICLPRRVRLVPRPGEPMGARLSDRSQGDTPLTVTSSNAQIQFLVEPEGGWSEFYFERGVLVRPVLDAKSGDLDAVLTISTAKHPNFVLKVPVHLEAPENKPDAN